MWVKNSDDILEAVNWAKANDDEARRIAANGQKFALRWEREDFPEILRHTGLLASEISPYGQVPEQEGPCLLLVQTAGRVFQTIEVRTFCWDVHGMILICRDGP